MSDRAGPNAEQIQYWNEVSGPKWVALDDVIDQQIAGIGQHAVDRANIQNGERVLDVGCGCGRTVLEIARRVGPAGRVTGVDISGPMLESARNRMSGEGVDHVELVQADAQIFDFAGDPFDLIFSRFGVMFFADPVAAFANLRGSLATGGRLAFVCWQELGSNPWMLVPTLAVAKHVQMPEMPAPGSPGPFAFADPERVAGILEEAGFEDIQHEAIETQLSVGGGLDLDETIHFLMQLGPAGALLREATEEVRNAAADSIREALTPFAGEQGVRMPSAAWFVSARKHTED